MNNCLPQSLQDIFRYFGIFFCIEPKQDLTAQFVSWFSGCADDGVNLIDVSRNDRRVLATVN